MTFEDVRTFREAVLTSALAQAAFRAGAEAAAAALVKESFNINVQDRHGVPPPKFSELYHRASPLGETTHCFVSHGLISQSTI